MDETFLTSGAILTVDLGNSSGSAVLATGPIAGPIAGPIGGLVGGPAGDTATGRVRLVELGAWSAKNEIEALAAAVQAGKAAAPTLSVAALSAVCSHTREEVALERLRAAGLHVVAYPDAGLELRIDAPDTCGADRKYAARGALELARLSSCDPHAGMIVVDAGTALTVDAVLPASAARVQGVAGVFLGGAIALGPGSLAASLAGAGARLPRFDLDPCVPALGRSTEEALRAGAVVGFRGAVRELCLAVAREAHGSLDSTVAVLTGGARDYARDPVLELFGSRVTEDPLLVHRGLVAAMGGRVE